MCGRFNVIDYPITQSIMELLGIQFDISTNDNVCPSELVSTLTLQGNQLTQVNANWGIKPDWAKKLIINAQAETITVKRTFKKAFLSSRCLIPISGWYEWKSDQSGQKKKFLFENRQQALFMAGILFKNLDEKPSHVTVDLFGEPLDPIKPALEFVSLTTNANDQCQPIHSRMPLIVSDSQVLNWLGDDLDKAVEVLYADSEPLKIRAID
jgi:putative SOS response-associated peptidase YedK